MCKDKNKIRNIILFGSVAREEAVKNSDIDLFIDVIKEIASQPTIQEYKFDWMVDLIDIK